MIKLDWDSKPAHKPTSKEHIKSVVSIVDVVRHYTGKEPKHNRCSCPFCTGTRTDTFVINPDKNRFICHRCGENGDVFAFVAALFGLDFADSLKKISVDFGIDNASEDAQRAADAARSLAKVKQDARNEALRQFHRAEDRFILLDNWSRLPPCDPRQAFAVRELAKARYYLDLAEDELYYLQRSCS